MKPSPPQSTPSPRLDFVDLARGLAILIMIPNHTVWWWLPNPFGPAQLRIATLTHLLAPAFFLLLAGFSLPLSREAALERGLSQRAWARRAGIRALWLLPAGYLLNLVLFPEYPRHLTGPVSTIGLACLFLIPILPKLTRAWVSGAILALGLGGYGVLAWKFEALSSFGSRHPAVVQLLFNDVPPWPFASLVLFGAVLGARWTACRNDTEKRRWFVRAGTFGLASLAIGGAAAGLGWITPDYPLELHDRFVVPFPSPLNALWTTGAAVLSLPLCHVLAKIAMVPKRWLGTLGRHSLLVYLVHYVFVVRVVAKGFNWNTSSWTVWTLATLALIAATVALARAAERLRSRPRG